MGVRPVDWPRSPVTTLLSVFCWAGLYIVCALFTKWLVALKPPRLNDSGKKQFTTKDDFSRFAAQCIVSIIGHTFLGPLAFYTAVMYHYFPIQASITSFSGSTADSIWVDVQTCRLGEVFTGNMVYQLVFWLLGWEKGMDMLLHHVGFLTAGVLVLTVVVYGKLAMGAVAMEMSSPLLNLHLLMRTLDGDGWKLLSNLAMTTFGAMFVLVRLGYYSYVVLEFNYLYWFRHELFPSWTPPVLTVSIMIVFTLGWILQLVWGKSVVLKSLKVLRAVACTMTPTSAQ